MRRRGGTAHDVSMLMGAHAREAHPRHDVQQLAEQAALAHERSAAVHEEAAIFFDARGETERAARHRVAGAANTERAKQIRARLHAQKERLVSEQAADIQRDLHAALEEIEGLRRAMQTRGLIEQAKGMIMVSLKIDAEAAFDVLCQRSQQNHQKVVDVARDVVANGLQSHQLGA